MRVVHWFKQLVHLSEQAKQRVNQFCWFTLAKTAGQRGWFTGPHYVVGLGGPQTPPTTVVNP